MPYRRLLLALTLAMTPIGVAAVRADVVVRVEGRVFDGGGIVDFDDPVEVTYTVRPGAVGSDEDAAPNVGSYLDATQPFTAIFAGGDHTITCMGTRIFVNDDVSGPIPLPANHDRLTFRGTGCVDSRGGTPPESFFTVRVVDTSGQSIDGDDLSDAVVLDLVAAANAGLFTLTCPEPQCDPGYGMSVAISGVTIVPEPERLGAQLAAFAALSAAARAARTKTARHGAPSLSIPSSGEGGTKDGTRAGS
jgi:hypothetical protein